MRVQIYLQVGNRLHSAGPIYPFASYIAEPSATHDALWYNGSFVLSQYLESCGFTIIGSYLGLVASD
jgi:hypothetical protein